MYRILPILLLVTYLCHDTNANPLFFPQQATSSKQSDGESENVSVYTTDRNAPYKRESPNVYEIIAKNVLERITSPVVSHFIIVTAKNTTTFSRLRALKAKTSTTTSKTPITKLELVEDEHKGHADESNSTKEPLDPDLIKTNPSFKTDRKLDRFTTPTTTNSTNSKANEIPHDEDEDYEEDEEEAEVEETHTEKPKRRNAENAFYTFLEFFAQIGIIFDGLYNTVFNNGNF